MCGVLQGLIENSECEDITEEIWLIKQNYSDLRIIFENKTIFHDQMMVFTSNPPKFSFFEFEIYESLLSWLKLRTVAKHFV